MLSARSDALGIVGVALALDHVAIDTLVAPLRLGEFLGRHGRLVALALGRTFAARLAGERALGRVSCGRP